MTEEIEMELLNDLLLNIRLGRQQGAPVCQVKLITRQKLDRGYAASVIESLSPESSGNYREVIYSRSFRSIEELSLIAPILRDSLRYVSLVFSRYLHSEEPSGIC